MEYPKVIKLENEKLKKLLEEKGELIMKGRAKSDEIVELDKQMSEIDQQVQEEEKKVDVNDLNERAKVITEKVNEAIKEMEAVKKEIYDRMKAQVPAELHAKYDSFKMLKDDAETERNKYALKAQKYNHKIIPLSKKLMKPFIEDEYEDYDSLGLENGEIVCSLFSHLNDFKINFAKKKQ